jgi:hypothetical protein
LNWPACDDVQISGIGCLHGKRILEILDDSGINERDAPVLESGGNLDYRRSEERGIIYDPVMVDVRTKTLINSKVEGYDFRLRSDEAERLGWTMDDLTAAQKS